MSEHWIDTPFAWAWMAGVAAMLGKQTTFCMLRVIYGVDVAASMTMAN